MDLDLLTQLIASTGLPYREMLCCYCTLMAPVVMGDHTNSSASSYNYEFCYLWICAKKAREFFSDFLKYMYMYLYHGSFRKQRCHP